MGFGGISQMEASLDPCKSNPAAPLLRWQGSREKMTKGIHDRHHRVTLTGVQGGAAFF